MPRGGARHAHWVEPTEHRRERQKTARRPDLEAALAGWKAETTSHEEVVHAMDKYPSPLSMGPEGLLYEVAGGLQKRGDIGIELVRDATTVTDLTKTVR